MKFCDLTSIFPLLDRRLLTNAVHAGKKGGFGRDTRGVLAAGPRAHARHQRRRPPHRPASRRSLLRQLLLWFTRATLNAVYAPRPGSRALPFKEKNSFTGSLKIRNNLQEDDWVCWDFCENFVNKNGNTLFRENGAFQPRPFMLATNCS